MTNRGKRTKKYTITHNNNTQLNKPALTNWTNPTHPM